MQPTQTLTEVSSPMIKKRPIIIQRCSIKNTPTYIKSQMAIVTQKISFLPFLSAICVKKGREPAHPMKNAKKIRFTSNGEVHVSDNFCCQLSRVRSELQSKSQLFIAGFASQIFSLLHSGWFEVLQYSHMQSGCCIIKPILQMNQFGDEIPHAIAKYAKT